MKRKGILVAGLLLFLAIAGYSQVKSGAYRLMLKTLLQHSVPETDVPSTVKDYPSLVLLDAREPREYAVSHLKGAVQVGYDHFELDKLPKLDKNSRIVVYCSVGYRSEKIAEKLIQAGYKNVSNLYGGIFEWVNQGHSVYNAKGRTQKVHAYDRTWGVWLNKGEKVYE
ncbi:MAG: rhodanese-like domain-containing protein [Bacteroidetes bacterium]|nr:MAG: rhodanese-like domain-containing protein [Bacteroidota bacterium]